MTMHRRTLLLLAIVPVLFTVAQSATPAKWYEVSGGTWTVDSAEVTRMASKLQDAGDASRGTKTSRTKALSKYVVQYQGMGPATKRQVRLSGSCDYDDRSPLELKKNFFNVMDGGDCYFDAVYDVQTQRFVGFLFNGVA
jgi:hypothetical protein